MIQYMLYLFGNNYYLLSMILNKNTHIYKRPSKIAEENSDTIFKLQKSLHILYFTTNKYNNNML